MKSEIPDNIMRLLQSSVPGDVVLGVIWCHKNLGVDWMLENFTYDRLPSKEDEAYPVNWSHEMGHDLFMKFKDCEIILGPVCIEARRTTIPEGWKHTFNFLYEE